MDVDDELDELFDVEEGSGFAQALVNFPGAGNFEEWHISRM